MVIQHNLMAMNADRQLGITTKSVANSTEKLSSGYQINRAADNAAGLAISEKMRKQIRGLSRASENSEDGISCVQTSEGALNEVEDMLQRMNELCVQAANGTNSVTDRQYIQDEIDQLVAEIDRVSETTKFNDTYLLKGDENQPAKLSYIEDYSVSYTRNMVSNAQTNAAPYKVNYKGNNNIYMVSNDIFNGGTGIETAEVIHKGDDITEYMMSSPYDGKSQATLNVGEYAAFVNVALNSTIADGASGLVNGELPTTTSLIRNQYDLSNNGLDDVVRANRDLFIYDTDTSKMIKVSAGTEMGDYLNSDNTMNERYRLVDVLSAAKTYVDALNGVTTTAGSTTATVVRYTGPSGTVYYVDEANSTSITTMQLSQGQDISDLYYESATQKWAYRNIWDIPVEFTYKVLSGSPEVTITAPFLIYDERQGYIASFTRMDGTTHKFTKLDGVEVPFRTLHIDSAMQGKLHRVEEASVYITTKDVTTASDKVQSMLLNGTTFSWDDAVLEPDQSKQKLYDANGKEVSGMALHKYFDDSGKYTGGLFTTSQARTIDEVFASTNNEKYQNLLAAGGQPALIASFINMNEQKVNGDLGIQIHAGSDSDLTNKVGLNIASLTSAGIGIDKLASKYIGIVDDTGLKATDAIDVVADAITTISRQRALLGAVQNRLEHTIKNLDNVVENTQAAESTIRDTDMAEEMVQYSNQNILQQAGQSMLAQANQANQGMLNLIQ